MTMNLHIDWDPLKAARNLRKHQVSFLLASGVFQDPLALSIFDTDHSGNEERWITLGKVHSHHVVVVHTWLEQNESAVHVRIISARKATANERRHYEG